MVTVSRHLNSQVGHSLTAHLDRDGVGVSSSSGTFHPKNLKSSCTWEYTGTSTQSNQLAI